MLEPNPKHRIIIDKGRVSIETFDDTAISAMSATRWLLINRVSMGEDEVDLIRASERDIKDFISLVDVTSHRMKPLIVRIPDTYEKGMHAMGYRRAPDVPNEYHKVIQKVLTND